VRLFRTLAAALLLVAVWVVAAAALKVPPPPDRRVNDYAGVLTPAERERLEQKLIERERGSSNQVVVARQRLKGSCPWVFAYDGEAMRFITDFLWRSPLGLRINAQDTAGVLMTEDWVKLRGDQLVPRDGVYELRITAELWETHFVDYVALLVVDHPAGTDISVDERFAIPPPTLAVYPTAPPRPVARAWDDRDRTSPIRCERVMGAISTPSDGELTRA